MAVPTFRGRVPASVNEAYRFTETRECPHCGEREFPDIGHVFKRETPFMSFGESGQIGITVETTCKTCKGEWVEVYDVAEIRPKKGGDDDEGA